jgi:hypothetical protein
VNLNLVGVVLVGAGTLFLYSAVKNVKPQDFLRNTIKSGGSSPAGGAVTPGTGGTVQKTTGTVSTGGTVAPLVPFENRSTF